MGHRHAISDVNWERIKDLLPGRPEDSGWVGKDNRLFIDAILYVAKTGIPWRDLPERFGNWDTAYKRFNRWSKKGTWKAVFEALQDTDLEWLILDSTVIRAHPCAAGAQKKRMAPAVRTSKHWAAAEADSAARFTLPSTVSACPSS